MLLTFFLYLYIWEIISKFIKEYTNTCVEIIIHIVSMAPSVYMTVTQSRTQINSTIHLCKDEFDATINLKRIPILKKITLSVTLTQLFLVIKVYGFCQYFFIRFILINVCSYIKIKIFQVCMKYLNEFFQDCLIYSFKVCNSFVDSIIFTIPR